MAVTTTGTTLDDEDDDDADDEDEDDYDEEDDYNDDEDVNADKDDDDDDDDDDSDADSGGVFWLHVCPPKKQLRYGSKHKDQRPMGTIPVRALARHNPDNGATGDGRARVWPEEP